MKRLLLFVGVLCVFFSTTFAAGPVGFGVQATGANVNFDGPAKEIYGFGFGGGVHLDINFIPMASIRIAGDYISFSPDQTKYAAYLAGLNGVQASDVAVDGGRINFISANANLKFTILPLPIFSPYATAGVGINSFTYSDLTVKYQGNVVGGVSNPSSQTKFSANLGAGINLNLVAVELYLEAKYTWIFTDGGSSTYIPVSIGVTL